MTTEAERIVEGFHAARPGATSAVFERTASYAHLAAAVAGHARVLDLACGDGPLLARLPQAIGLDRSAAELRRAAARGIAASRLVQGRAQALPFAAGCFDAITCHLALMLFDDLDRVIAEIRRVLAPGGVFAAMLGGGPVADGPSQPPDAFHRFLALARPHLDATPLGDPRASSEAGWRALFPGFAVAPFARLEHDLSGSFAEAWTFLGASYQLRPGAAASIRAALAAEYPSHADAHVPLRVVTFLATAQASTAIPRPTLRTCSDEVAFSQSPVPI